jgi:hypothetical protein
VLDLTTGVSTPVMATPDPTYLAIGGSTLLVKFDRTLSTYSVAGATLTPLAVRFLHNREYALSRDGRDLLVTTVEDDTTSVRHLETSALTTKRRLTFAADVSAVAWSSDASRYAVGLGVQGNEDVVNVFDGGSDLLRARSVWPGAGWPRLQDVHHLDFAGGATLLHGLGYSEATGTAFVTASAQPGVAATLSVTATSPSAYGKTLHAEIRTTACSPCSVRLTLADSLAGTRTFTRTVSGGRLSLDLGVKGNGRLTVTLPETLNRIRLTRKLSYVVPARAAVTLTGSYKLKDGTAVYSDGRPTTLVVVAPARATLVTESLQRRFGGKWATDRTRDQRTGSNGRLRTTVPVVKNLRYRIVYRVVPDAYNAKSPAAITRAVIWK